MLCAAYFCCALGAYQTTCVLRRYQVSPSLTLALALALSLAQALASYPLSTYRQTSPPPALDAKSKQAFSCIN